MEEILKQIKCSLKEIKKQQNFKYKHYKNRYQEILEYTDFYSLNRRKHYLIFRFIFQKAEKSLSFNYNYVFNSKNIVINKSHSLANYKNDELPGIDRTFLDKLEDIYRFKVEDNKIINTVNLDSQVKMILEVFNANYRTIIEYAKSLKNA